MKEKIKFNPFFKAVYDTIDTQIEMYNRFKKGMQKAAQLKKIKDPKILKEMEDEALNGVLVSRIKLYKIMPGFSEKEAIDYFLPLTEKLNKTLKEIILKIIKYEFIDSRKKTLKGIPSEHIKSFLSETEKYAEEAIKENEKKWEDDSKWWKRQYKFF